MPCGASLEVTAIANREGDVEVSDHADLEIRVLPILPRERIDEIIRQHLREHGWEEQPDGSLHKQIGDAIAVLPPDSSTIRVTLSDETSVSVSAKARNLVAVGEEAQGQSAVEAKAAAEAERKLAAASEEAKRALEAKTADRLLKAWHEVRAEIDEVVNATTKQALQQRASELGSIESLEEGRDANGGYEVTITVRT